MMSAESKKMALGAAIFVAGICVWTAISAYSDHTTNETRNRRMESIDRMADLERQRIEFETAIEVSKIEREIDAIESQRLDLEEELIRNEMRINEILHGK